MHFPSLSTVILGFCISSVLGSALSVRQVHGTTDVQERNRHPRDFTLENADPLEKRQDVIKVGMGATGETNNPNTLLNINEVDGCTAIFIWTNDGNLIGGHAGPGQEYEVSLAMKARLGESVVAYILIWARNRNAQNVILNELEDVGFSQSAIDNVDENIYAFTPGTARRSEFHGYSSLRGVAPQYTSV